MSKKVLYMSIINPAESGVGVSSKIYKQMECFKKGGYQVKHFLYQMNKTGLKKISFHFYGSNRKQNLALIQECKDVDLLYIRYFFSDPNLIQLLKNLKHLYSHLKIFVEIPTYPYDGEYSKFSYSLWIDKHSRKKLHQYVDRIVTYSEDQQIYQVLTIPISNAVDVGSIRQRKVHNPPDSGIHIIMVAQMAFWHGYDRVLEGLKQYYANQGKENIQLHFVGDGDPTVLSEYQTLANTDLLKGHVFFYGRKSGEELNAIYDKCSLAMDSMGRHRTSVYYNSTLKGKEYLAKGLPIISGVKTELDNMDFQYYLRVPADDSPVDFEQIVQFYHNIYNKKDEAEIANKIRSFCSTHFEFSQTFQPVLNEIKSKETLDHFL